MINRTRECTLAYYEVDIISAIYLQLWDIDILSASERERKREREFGEPIAQNIGVQHSVILRGGYYAHTLGF